MIMFKIVALSKEKLGEKLYQAVSAQKADLVKSLIEKKADVNYRDSHDKAGYSVLHQAAVHQPQTKILKMILNTEGIDINATTNSGMSALHVAVFHGTACSSEKSVRLLIESKIDTSITTKNGTARELAKRLMYTKTNSILKLLEEAEKKKET